MLSKVDAAVLQYQNQKLVQQLDVQKHELHDLETKIKELKDRQSSYDDMLISLNQLWNQLVDDLILLGVRAGGGHNALETLDCGDTSRDSIPSCPVEEMFLCRLLERDSIDCSDNDAIANYVEQVLSSRHSSTMELLKSLEDTIAAESVKTESMALALQGNISAEDNIMQLSKIDDMMKEEAKNFRDVIDALHLKHKEYTDRIQVYISSHSTDQSEIKRLQGDLEEIMAELEQSRRKLVNLGMQKNVASGMHASTQVAANGTLSPEKTADKTRGLREIKDSIEEAKTVAEDRLKELQDALQQNLIYSKQLQDLQNELKDDKFVQSSRLYTLLSDQLQHWNAELGQYKALTDTLQTDRLLVMREKELNLKAESADAARNTIDNADSRIEELELQLQKCIIEKNDLEIKMEEAMQDAGKNDIKAEFRVMASALSKEMGMMEAQLSRWKETAHEAISLRHETESLKALLSDKTNQQKRLADECAEQIVEIKSLKVSHGKVMQKVGVEVIGLGALKLTGFLRELMQQNNVNFESLYTVRTLTETGKSKHYGFIEFKNPEVAEVVADCMHNYLLFEHLLQVHLIPLEHFHPKFKAVIGIEPVYIFSLSSGSNLEKHDVKVSVNTIAIIIKAVSIALEKNQKLMVRHF
ncbi:hypothetical protein COLO4_17533 [Corchorus olitorius]|uniref:E3 ubiquitin protein ligase n=1 Tax=Corchorus olitorius TaxID=93759 RepID=A0A1R3JCD5_9ROSI|nr:hypothetical protein COLO4_17533 [Corchorus olitorius]